MRTLCHKLWSVIITMAIVVGLVDVASVCKVHAAVAHTQDEAIVWVWTQLGRTDMDYDHDNGQQCVDLIMYYYNYLGVAHVSGNGKDYATNPLPDGWKRIKGGIPQKGDILVYEGTTSNPPGHVAIYAGDNTIYHGRFNGIGEVQVTTTTPYNGFPAPYWGIVRPDWSSSSGSSTSNPVENSYIFSSIRAENITTTSAKIIADYTKDTYGDVGFYFGTSPDLAAMTKVSEFKYSSIVTTTSFNNSYQVGVYYDDTYKYKWWPALTPGTTYYYAFYCTKNGVEHISSIQSFATVGGGESAFPLIDGEIYKIYSALSGHVMEVSDGDSANGKRITLWPYGGASWMQWKAVQHPDGYSFVNVATGKALDISGGSAEAKAVLQQWDYKAVDAQRFRLVDQGNSRYGMFARCSGLAVDVYASVTSPGATMAQYAFHGGDNQLWYFELIDKTAPVISNVRVTDVDSTGYTVLCDVTDNAGVARVAFPTWTGANGQDDIAQDWYDSCAVFQPSYGNTYVFRVNSAAHNNEYGLYTTHIYAYDAAGNSISEGCDVSVPSPTVPTPEPTAMPTPSPSVSSTLSGSVKCFGKSTLTTTIQLINSSGAATASTTVTGNTAEYKLEKMPVGTYILRVSKPDHVTRDYTITMNGTNVRQDVEIRLLGDVSGDGMITFRDKKMLYNHLEKIAVLSGYLFNVGDVNGDGMISFRDKKMLFNHIERIAPIWKEN